MVLSPAGYFNREVWIKFISKYCGTGGSFRDARVDSECTICYLKVGACKCSWSSNPVGGSYVFQCSESYIFGTLKAW